MGCKIIKLTREKKVPYLVSPETHRSNAGVKQRRRRATALHRNGEPEREEKKGDVHLDRKLTLSTKERTARSEEVGDGGDVAAELRSLTVKKISICPVHGLPASVRRRGCRGGGGGARGPVRFALLPLNRRRRARRPSTARVRLRENRGREGAEERCRAEEHGGPGGSFKRDEARGGGAWHRRVAMAARRCGSAARRASLQRETVTLRKPPRLHFSITTKPLAISSK